MGIYYLLEKGFEYVIIVSEVIGIIVVVGILTYVVMKGK